ncbi:glycosyltransferase WbsX family protein [Acinetobacter johnsonii]|uniref:glycosyltransferase WbsX family protein n=1 Tax=Acinetobacter johnsonii TaxID=40214 RepID=UPI0024922411|nr:glycoside hydrolase family 99-like domain-containing protein [Acinetobacter johnsonii]
MKIFAFYLPQYHSIPENDAWWGEGFTEWTNVRKARPLCIHHNQPRVPYGQNYYNLLDKKTLIWQSDLMKKYKIDGLCFYHYWFSGRKILEKPAEQLLKNPEIHIPFFFSWANEPWTRSWDGLNQDVLLEQTYGERQDWIDHFNYLLPFFKDERYIKHNGHPIFVLYRSASFDLCDEWIKCWRELAFLNHLGDIHFVTSLTSFETDSRELDFDAQLYFEPMNTTAHYMHNYKRNRIEKLRKKASNITNRMFGYSKKIQSFDYNAAWEEILKKPLNTKTYAGAFIDWDNTARKGIKGSIAKNANPLNFRKNFKILYKNALDTNTPYIFINAWNEWAEGTYLEPDTKHEYGYLEAIEETVTEYQAIEK